ncbi:haloalkane dehalogenase [Hyaloraphidium curvatum]|nr:haloalkane dehalogenase [Hyaloraphidium curvatum]
MALQTAAGPKEGVFRQSEAAFEALKDWPFRPHYLDFEGLRVHHIDERPEGAGDDAPVVLALHGEPTWSYLYRKWVGPLVAAGFRFVAPDHVGFGRSDKPTDDNWYNIEKHSQRIRHLIESLDLKRITIVVQDWGGPTGLRQVVDMPDRFERVIWLNSWLHHEGYEPSPGLLWWRETATDPAQNGGDMPCGKLIAGYHKRAFTADKTAEALAAAYDAPFDGEKTKAGPRRFPYCLPFAEPALGNAAEQQRCWDAIPKLGIPVHVAFGADDGLFPWSTAKEIHAHVPGSTLDRIAACLHYPQEEAPEECVALLLKYSAKTGAA